MRLTRFYPRISVFNYSLLGFTRFSQLCMLLHFGLQPRAHSYFYQYVLLEAFLLVHIMQ